MEVEAVCGVAVVEGVAKDWEAAAGEVNADLVGAAGLERAFYEEARAVFYGDFFEDTEVCFGILAAAGFVNLTPLTMLGFIGDAVHIEFDGESGS